MRASEASQCHGQGNDWVPVTCMPLKSRAWARLAMSLSGSSALGGGLTGNRLSCRKTAALSREQARFRIRSGVGNPNWT